MKYQELLNIDANPKTVKGRAKGYMTAILYLAPYTLSGTNLCPKASAGCAAACLNTAGRGQMNSVQTARLKKTRYFLERRDEFIAQLKVEILAAKRRAAKLGLTLVVRLNGTSDVVWDKISDVIQTFPDTQFYDYTKIAKRFLFDRPANYDLTFSLSEDNLKDAEMVLKLGGRVAVVFRDSNYPESFLGYPVMNGDDTDLRFLDGSGIVALYAKGKARHDTTGFVQECNSETSEARVA